MSGRLKTLNSNKRSRKIQLLQCAAVASAAKKAKICENLIPTTPETTIIAASEFEYHIQRFKDYKCIRIQPNMSSYRIKHKSIKIPTTCSDYNHSNTRIIFDEIRHF